MLEQWALMASSGRAICDLSREELEDLVEETHELLRLRKLRRHELEELVKKSHTRVQLAEFSVQSVNQDCLRPPGVLSSADARAVIGSFNPYEGATRRVQSLQLRLSGLQQQIVEVQSDLDYLLEEQNELRRRLERGPKTPTLFCRTSTVPVRDKSADPAECIRVLEGLIRAEENPEEKDVLVCCHHLLTGYDSKAVDLLAPIWWPAARPGDAERLAEAIRDREAQAAMLLQALRRLYDRHQQLSEALTDVQRRTRGHALGDGLEAATREKSRELDDSLAAAEKIRGAIDKLLEAQTGLQRELQEAKEANQRAAADEVAPRREQMELMAAIAGKKAEKGILDDQRAKITSELENCEGATQEVQRGIRWTENELHRLREQRQQMEEHWDLLDRAGVRAGILPEFINWVAQGKTAEQVYNELNEEKRALEEERAGLSAEKVRKKAAIRQLNQDLWDIRAAITTLRAPHGATHPGPDEGRPGRGDT
jgi:hypothetical protein